MKFRTLCAVASVVVFTTNASAAVRETTITITEAPVQIGDAVRTTMTIDGQIPGPTLRWRVGDLARVHVRNAMDVPTSVHWHGVLLPNAQDGVPGVTTPSIPGGGSYTFEIPVTHPGTYWYHSHTGLQEQRGVYGAILIEPATPRPGLKVDADHVVVLSDWTDEDPREVMRLLKRGSEYFSIEKGTAQSLWGAFAAGELGSVFQRSLQRMPPMDISDVAYDAFLANGKRELHIPADPGERVRIRLINAAASTYFYLNQGGGPLRVVAADGVNVQPTELNRILMAVAETYDVILDIPEKGSVELLATAQDGSGHASIWIGDGPPRPAGAVPRPNLYSMRHRGHDAPPATPHSAHKGKHTNHAAHRATSPGHHAHARPAAADDPRPPAPYRSLHATVPTKLPPEAPTRTIALRLTGNMDRYVWSINGRTLAESDDIPVAKGEVLRLELKNETMMHHPIHLHGHFFRVLDGDDEMAPLKHTVDVAPMQTTTIEFLADAEGDWSLHCHVLYHMKSGMARVIAYDGWSPSPDVEHERAVIERDRWYSWVDALVLSNFTEGSASTSNTRHEIFGEWEFGWQDVAGIEYESVIGWRYHASRLYRPLIGASLENDRNAGILGLEALLPLNFVTRVWVDTQGDGRFALAKGMALTARLSGFGEVRYDTKQAWEGQLGLRWRVQRWGSLAIVWHSDFGFGGGIELIY